MSGIKKEIKFFTVMDYAEESEYLSKMHKHGWKLNKITLPGIYTFLECDPEEVVYQLDYNKDGSAHMSEYVQMFKDMGWEYLFDFVGYSYFRKPVSEMENEEEIFCDDDSRFDMMKRVFKGRMIPLILIFCFVLAPGLIIDIYNSVVNGANDWDMIVVLSLVTIMYISIFIKFAIKYFNFKKKIGR